MESKEFDRFIEAWGSMGVLWGINRSMARIHAFLILSNAPVDLDKIADSLHISRGNASMCLKELRNWGIIQRVHTSGDRRDFYEAEPDIWKMFFRIAGERKKREFDPALGAIRQLISDAETKKDDKVHERLTQMEITLTMLNRITNKFLEDEKKGKTLLNLFKNVILSKKG